MTTYFGFKCKGFYFIFTVNVYLERLEEYNNLKYQKEALLSMREELAEELELMNAAGFQESSHHGSKGIKYPQKKDY